MYKFHLIAFVLNLPENINSLLLSAASNPLFIAMSADLCMSLHSRLRRLMLLTRRFV